MDLAFARLIFRFAIEKHTQAWVELVTECRRLKEQGLSSSDAGVLSQHENWTLDRCHSCRSSDGARAE
jgi:hypothetical protein